MKKLLITLGIVATLCLILTVGYFINDRLITKQEQPTTYVALPEVDTKPLNADTIFNLVNAEREKVGLKPLVRDARLDATAQARADDMVARNYFSHNDPVTGEKMINKQEAGCRFSENISENWNTDSNVVSGWMNSKKHHDAILLAEYNTTGVAVSGSKVVQHFCTR